MVRLDINGGTLCGGLLCGFTDYKNCARWDDALGKFVKAAVHLIEKRQFHICRERDLQRKTGNVTLLGGPHSPKGSC